MEEPYNTTSKIYNATHTALTLTGNYQGCN